ncbi:MAG: ferrous iron transporter B [Miniphocaeibacter sp.]|uniref:FeoB small GTPase domain-containing protein n=1 Tax=Miniphocaeibacter sp. TaxID=3100973 RepID=UPI0017F3EB47|nr:ferrous iron transporter B [Gallicola sp.]
MSIDSENIEKNKKIRAGTEHKHLLLMGGPNVGKSVFFSELTGVYVVSSNYTGTTVSFMEGDIELEDGKHYHLIDVPGTYTMSATSEAEEVAIHFMEAEPIAVLFVLDSTNLEGGLRLALELRKYKVPIVYALNMMDVASRKGIEINIPLLSQKLGGPVIPTVAVKKQGFDDIKVALQGAIDGKIICPEPLECPPCKEMDKLEEKATNNKDYGEVYWEEAKKIAREVTSTKKESPSFVDKLGKAMMKPWPGIPLAILIIGLSLGVVVGGGKALRAVALLPLVNDIIVPFFRSIFTAILSPGMLQNIMIGEYGVFVIFFEWVVALIMPYVILFYVVFSFLEDSGYLPRLAVLFDGLMRKLGIQGGSLINIMLGFGCAVPAIIGTRTATTRKERLMVTTMICFAIPCISQTGALIALVGDYSIFMLLGIVLMTLLIFIIVGLITKRLFKGKVDPLIIEVPNLLIPERKAYWTKLKVRLKSFIFEAEGPMLIAIVIAAVLKESGLLDIIARVLEPIMSGWLGMPKESVIVLILGIVRREMAVAPLLEMNLTTLQMFTGAMVGMLYLPCLSVFGILAKEFNAKVAIGITLSTIFTALFVGGLINHIGTFLLGVLG